MAPGNPWVGLLLPYSPLHELLVRACAGPVIATSGNLAEEPICHENAEARHRLAGLADAFLEHDRGIAHPVDDSVARAGAAGVVRLRRARGHAPSAFALPAALGGSWLCAGAQMKCAVAVAEGRRLVVGPHLGDLDGAPTQEAFARSIATLSGVLGRQPTAVACDAHPDYASTAFAEQTGLPCLRVQHHLAHVLACLLENDAAPESVLGIAWDGAGFGEDGTVWGGEFLLLAGGRATRFARLRPFRLPGGDAAARDGRRCALSLLHQSLPEEFGPWASALGLASSEKVIRRLLESGLRSPWCSSVGRLFDAAGALLGLGGVNRFEGQTALKVEAAAVEGSGTSHAPGVGTPPGSAEAWPVRRAGPGDGVAWEVDWEPWLRSMAGTTDAFAEAPERARRFHAGLAGAAVAVARAAGVATVALSGGCFQNLLLLEETRSALAAAGLRVLLHRELPPNDGNISAGQAMAACLGLSRVSSFP